MHLAALLALLPPADPTLLDACDALIERGDAAYTVRIEILSAPDDPLLGRVTYPALAEDGLSKNATATETRSDVAEIAYDRRDLAEDETARRILRSAGLRERRVRSARGHIVRVNDDGVAALILRFYDKRGAEIAKRGVLMSTMGINVYPCR